METPEQGLQNVQIDRLYREVGILHMQNQEAHEILGQMSEQDVLKTQRIVELEAQVEELQLEKAEEDFESGEEEEHERVG